MGNIAMARPIDIDVRRSLASQLHLVSAEITSVAG